MRIDLAAPAQCAIGQFRQQRAVALAERCSIESVIEQYVGLRFLAIDFEQDLAGELAYVFRVIRDGHRV